MSYAKLRGKIREVYGVQEAFAAGMDMNKSTLSQKLNGKSEWTRAEIETACLLLSIPVDEVPAYFFTAKVGISQHSKGR